MRYIHQALRQWLVINSYHKINIAELMDWGSKTFPVVKQISNFCRHDKKLALAEIGRVADELENGTFRFRTSAVGRNFDPMEVGEEEIGKLGWDKWTLLAALRDLQSWISSADAIIYPAEKYTKEYMKH